MDRREGGREGGRKGGINSGCGRPGYEVKVIITQLPEGCII